MSTSTATITLSGSAPSTPQPAQQPIAPAPPMSNQQQGQGRRRRQRQNVPEHMRAAQGTGSPTSYSTPVSFGTVYTTTKPIQQSTTTPAANYQTQSLFKDPPQNAQQTQHQVYIPGPRDQSAIDERRAAEAREKLREMNIAPELVEQYRRRFNVLDLNKDGVVNLREFAAISRVLGYKFTKEEVLEIFGRRDLDDSGGISFDEFVLAMYERQQKSKQLAPYREIFRMYDWRDRGYITSDEAYPILKKELGFDENKTEMLIDLFDRNRDYRLSLLEFIPFYQRVQELKNQVHNAFRDFDRDGDGFVSASEAKAVLGPKGFSDQQVDALIFKYDKDADGQLNFQEFAAFWDVQIV